MVVKCRQQEKLDLLKFLVNKGFFPAFWNSLYNLNIVSTLLDFDIRKLYSIGCLFIQIGL